MQFGIHLGPQNTSVAELRRLWSWLDEAGIDWISLWDHIYETPPADGTIEHHEAFSMLGALAADTKNARIGCLVFCSQYRNVGILTKGAVSVDHISGGRFEMGMGSGWHDQEAKAFGVHFPPIAERMRTLEHQLQVINEWRQGARVTHSGEGVELVNAAMNPGPLGKLPIWVGGTGRMKTLRMAGACADGWNAAYVPPAEYAELNSVLDGWCEKAGRDPAEVERSINLMWALSNDDPKVVRKKMEDQWGTAAQRVMDGTLHGRPEDALEQVARFVDAGAQMLNVAIRPPWDQEILAEYVERIIPAMKREFAN
jgi:alkanesulfonate monooxygenase SsuD/methylene tetrahydromethanopterin reductase-like flavin-dependent oxidoreductase (luciferase family)